MLNLLERQLAGAVPPSTIQALAGGLVLREIHRDEVAILSDKVSSLQKSLRTKLQANTSAHSSSDGLSTPPSSSDRSPVSPSIVPQLPLGYLERPPTAQGSRSVPKWDLPSPTDDMTTIIREKDSIIRRKDEEYVQLRSVLNDTQLDVQGVLDLNAQYLGIISHYNQMQLTVQASASRFPQKSVAELEHKLGEAETRITELTGELDIVNNELSSKEKELNRLEAKQSKHRELLGVPLDADDAAIEEQIQHLLADGSLRHHEIDKMQRELAKVIEEKRELNDRLFSLNREKEKIEFHLRQQELTVKKIKRQQTAKDAIHQAVEYIQAQTGDDRISSQIKLPSIERIGSQIGLAAKSNRTNQQYCVFCRAEYLPLKSHVCRIHFRPIRNGKWTCCRDDCHRSPGCLQVPHFYIEITVDRKVFLTDGARYMELTYLTHN